LHQTVGAILTAWQEAETAVADAAAVGRTVLRVGFVASAANEMTSEIIAAFAQLRPGWRVAMTQTPWSDPTAGLADGSVHAALLRLPLPGHEDLIDNEPLLTEPMWIAMSSSHPLAGRKRVAFSELLGEPFVATPPDSGGWRDYWLGTAHRNGRPAVIGAEANSPDEWLQAISNGQGISLTPAATARFYARPGLTYLPLDGVDPSVVAVCWRHNERRTAVHDFVLCCRRTSQARTTT
jgi:DNA-binding transcriptional LysR family regulator